MQYQYANVYFRKKSKHYITKDKNKQYKNNDMFKMVKG